jgi:hypothetical protein
MQIGHFFDLAMAVHLLRAHKPASILAVDLYRAVLPSFTQMDTISRLPTLAAGLVKVLQEKARASGSDSIANFLAGG